MTRVPNFENTTRLVARALGLSADVLLAGFRPAHADDLNAVVEFRQRHSDEHMRPDDSDYLRWRYRFGRTDRGLGDLWVLHYETELLGIIGTEDMACSHGGKRWVGVRTMDIMVDKRLQSSGLGVWLNQAVFRNRDFTIAVGGNKNSSGTVKRLFHALPPTRQFIQPINTSSYVLRKLRQGILAALVSALANRAMHVWRTLGALSVGDNTEIRPITCFTEPLIARTDAVNRVIIERCAAFLNYRLFDNPRTPYLAVGAYRMGKLVGYIAWRIVTRGDGERWVHIVDWQTGDTARDDTLLVLLGYVGRKAEAAQCSFVLLVQHEGDHRRVLRRAGFWGPRVGSEKIIGLHAEDAATFETLSKADWFLTDLCDDNDGL
jgi:hypothetical protein